MYARQSWMSLGAMLRRVLRFILTCETRSGPRGTLVENGRASAERVLHDSVYVLPVKHAQ